MTYTLWQREIATLAFRRWAVETRLTQYNLARYLGLSEETVRRLERGGTAMPEVVQRLVDLDILAPVDMEPDLRLARKLRELDGHLTRRAI